MSTHKKNASRCVICLLFGKWGAKVSTFFVTSDLFISAAFRATIAIKVCKIISMIRSIDWSTLEVRARGCARGNRTPTQIIFKNMQKSPYHGVSVLTRSARTSARTNFWCAPLNGGDHGDFFDYLIVNLAQKAEKIQLVENQKNFQKSSKISKNSKFFDFLLIFSTFKFMYNIF